MVEPGQVIDSKYRIVRLIGEGGMGSVFEGENMRISRRVAIKVLHGAALANPETVQRFEREAQAAGRIGSEHILEILDLGVLADGERYMVMEYLDGETLSARIRRNGRLTPEQIVPLVRQALVGLGAAHNAGIVHRDLKPDNIFVLNERSGIRDYVKIIDFGISKFNALGGDMNMTRTGAVMGTPFYMSPEQAKGSGQVDARSDLYAMGVILYEAVTGEVPFTANTFNELMFKIVLSDPRPLTELQPDIDPQFTAIVTRAMAREAAQRFASAAEMIQALDALPFRGTQPGAMAGGFASQADAPRSALGLTPAPGMAQGTQGSFATSQQGVSGRSGGSMAAIAAVVGVLVLGGGAFAAYHAFAGKGAAAADAAPSATVESAAAVPVQPEPARPVETAPATATVAPVASVAPVAPAAESSASAAPAATAPVAVAAEKPAARPRVAPPAPRRPAPAPAKPSTSKHSSTRDFGY